jgi:hypothetical protein
MAFLYSVVQLRLDVAFSSFVWLSEMVSAFFIRQSNNMHYYGLQQNEMLVISIIVLKCLP